MSSFFSRSRSRFGVYFDDDDDDDGRFEKRLGGRKGGEGKLGEGGEDVRGLHYFQR